MSNVTNFNLKDFYGILTQNGSLLYQYQFVAEFFGLDDSWGITDSKDAGGNITYYIQSTSIPGVSLTQAKTAYLGTEFRVPGVLQFGHSWSCKVFIVQNMRIYNGFRKWQEHISSLQLDGGGQKGIPNVKARISILSPDAKEKHSSFVLEGLWIKSLGEMSMKYEQGGGNPIKDFAIDFKYQYVYRDDNFDGNGDPLKA